MSNDNKEKYLIMLQRKSEIKNLDQNKIIRCIIICTIFCFFHYGLGFRVNFQPDIYGRVFGIQQDFWSVIFNKDGRPINGFLVYIFHCLPFTVSYYISLTIGMILIIISSGRFAILLISEVWGSNNKEKNVLHAMVVCILSCLTIANIFSADFFLYIDMTVTFALAICLSVEATIMYVLSLREEGSKKCIRSFLLLLMVVFLYETISSLFFVLTVPFVLKYSSNFFSFIKKQILAGVCYAFPITLKSIYTKLMINSPRAKFDNPSFVESAQIYLPKGSTPKEFVLNRITFGMWGYAILCTLVIMGLFVFCIRKKQYIEIVKVIYLSMVVVIVGLLPFLVRVSNDYKPRIYYPLGAYFGILCIYVIITGNLNFLGLQYRHFEKVFICTLFFMTGIQWLSFVQMYVDCYITNYEDKYISEMIGNCIDNYEKESGYQVDRVVFYEDATKTKYSINGWCLTTRVYAAWSEIDALNLYLNRDYRTGQPDEELALFFYSKDWDCFSNEQVVCKENTAHICKY